MVLAQHEPGRGLLGDIGLGEQKGKEESGNEGALWWEQGVH